MHAHIADVFVIMHVWNAAKWAMIENTSMHTPPAVHTDSSKSDKTTLSCSRSKESVDPRAQQEENEEEHIRPTRSAAHNFSQVPCINKHMNMEY